MVRSIFDRHFSTAGAFNNTPPTEVRWNTASNSTTCHTNLVHAIHPQLLLLLLLRPKPQPTALVPGIFTITDKFSRANVGLSREQTSVRFYSVLLLAGRRLETMFPCDYISCLRLRTARAYEVQS